MITSTAFAERNYLGWSSRNDPTVTNSSQRGVAVAMDRRGNVAAVGFNDLSQNKWYTARYDSLTGSPLWEKTYSSVFYLDRPTCVTTDGNGDVIVGGYSQSSNQDDFYVIKYAATDGAVLWSKSYNNANENGNDRIVAIAVDAANNVIVTGTSVDDSKLEDFYTIKYAANGTQLWAKRYSTFHSDVPAAVAIAPNSDVIVTGRSRVLLGDNDCFYTVRYKSSDGTVLWDETYDNTFDDDDDAATDVVVTSGDALDPNGAALVTGYSRNYDGTYSFHTIKYPDVGGNPRWSKDYMAPGSNSLQTPSIGTDAAGNAVVAGTARLDNNKVVYYVAKYGSRNGTVLWENNTSAPAGSPPDAIVEDGVNDMAVDKFGDVIVTGTSYVSETSNDYLTVKLSGGSGTILWQQRYNGQAASGSDEAYSVATDSAGNVAVIGTTRKGGNSAFFEMTTLKYNRFVLSTGDPVAGPGLSDGAFISALNVPATADDGTVVTRITVKDGKTVFGAILRKRNGDNFVGALQGQPAPGVTGSTFKSFSDPVCSADGTYSFAAKLAGVSKTEASGIWTTITNVNGTPQLALQNNKQVNGLPPGTLLKSVLSISQVGSRLLALIAVKGPGVTNSNNTVLYRLTDEGGTALLRTGQTLSINGTQSTIKKLSIYAPPKTSPGHGRYQGSNLTVANATLADNRSVLLSVTGAGSVSSIAASKGPATAIGVEAMWKSFGPFGASVSGYNQTARATLTPKVGGITTLDDTVILTSTNGSAVDGILARESAPAPGIVSARYLDLSDPVSNNNGNFAFLAKIKGAGVTGLNDTALYFGPSGGMEPLVRTGSIVADAAGFALPQTFAGFKSFALPSNSAPIFLATVKGIGVSGKNNFGLWGFDSDGVQRQLLRNGDQLGDVTVNKFTMLTPAVGVLNASRSFNTVGGVTALVGLSDKKFAIIYVGIP